MLISRNTSKEVTKLVHVYLTQLVNRFKTAYFLPSM